MCFFLQENKGQMEIGVPWRTGACRRGLFTHAYERAKLPLASDSERFAGAYHHVIHVLHYRTTENVYTLSSSPSYLCRAEALGLSLTVIQ